MSTNNFGLTSQNSNESLVIKTFLKESLPFSQNYPVLFHPKLKIGSAVINAVSKETNFNSETFFNHQVEFEKSGLKSSFKPLWTFFTFPGVSLLPTPINVGTINSNLQERLLQLKFFHVLTTALKNLYFQTLSTRITLHNSDLNVNENIFIDTFLHLFNEKPFILEIPLDLLEKNLIYKKSRVNSTPFKKALVKFMKNILNMEVQRHFKKLDVNKVKTENMTTYRPFSFQKNNVKGAKLYLTLNLAFLLQDQIQHQNLGLFSSLFF